MIHAMKASCNTLSVIPLFFFSLGTYGALYPMGVPQAAVGVASVAAVLGAPLRVLLTAVKAVREGHGIMRSISDCLSEISQADLWQSTPPSEKDRDRTDEDDELALRANRPYVLLNSNSLPKRLMCS